MKEQLISTIYIIVLLFSIVSLVGIVYIFRLLDKMIMIENNYVYSVNTIELNFIKTLNIILLISILLGLMKNSANVLKTQNITVMTGIDMTSQFLAAIALGILLNKLYSARNTEGDLYTFEATTTTYNYIKFGVIVVMIIVSIDLLRILYTGLELFYFDPVSM